MKFECRKRTQPTVHTCRFSRTRDAQNNISAHFLKRVSRIGKQRSMTKRHKMKKSRRNGKGSPFSIKIYMESGNRRTIISRDMIHSLVRLSGGGTPGSPRPKGHNTPRGRRPAIYPRQAPNQSETSPVSGFTLICLCL